jgi:5'-phosphate synthase pdxT subunit
MTSQIGVLAIQGSVAEHVSSLEKIGVKSVLVRSIEDLNKVEKLIMPGGESTTIGKLLWRFGLAEEIIKRVNDKSLAIWGTCAGAILLAKNIEGRDQADSLRLMDIIILRNAYGGQLDSFETKVEFDFDGTNKEIDAVFIRAPEIKEVMGKTKVLAYHKKEIVAAHEGRMLATTFHPEMTEDLKIHSWFVNNL